VDRPGTKLPPFAKALVDMVAIPSMVAKWFVTSGIPFQVAQMARDPATATMQSMSPKTGLLNKMLWQPIKGRLAPLAEITRDAGRTIGNALGRTPDIEEALFQAVYQRGPGMFSNMSYHDLASQEKAFERLQLNVRHGRKLGDAIYLAKNPLELIEKLKAPFESSTRKAETRRYRSVGMGDVASNIAGKDISVDFSRYGAAPFMHDANRIFPFMNPGLQSVRKFYQTMKGYDPVTNKYDPKRAAEIWARAALWQTVPTIILWALNKGDDEIEEQRKGQTGLYYHFFRTPEGKLVAMPKAFTWSTVFSTFPEAMLDAMHDADPDTLTPMIESIRGAFGWKPYVYNATTELDRKPLGRAAKAIAGEIKAGGLPTAYNIVEGISTNIDPFYKRTIEMPSQRHLEAPQRQGYRTGALSKGISQVQFDALKAASDNPLAKALDIDLSKAALGPDQIDFIVSQFGARDPYRALDYTVSEGIGKPMPAQSFHPGWNVLGRRRVAPEEPRSTGFSSETFDRLAEEAKQIVDTEKEIKKKDRGALSDYRKGRDITWAKELMEAKAEIDKRQKERSKISQSTTMPAEKRKEKLDKLTREIRQLERRAIAKTNAKEKKAGKK
jgi:hypothetical protein